MGTKLQVHFSRDRSYCLSREFSWSTKLSRSRKVDQSAIPGDGSVNARVASVYERSY